MLGVSLNNIVLTSKVYIKRYMNIPNEKNDDIFNNIPYNQVTTDIPPLPFNIMNFLN